MISKLKKISNLISEVDDEVWKVFFEYQKERGFYFSDPERWVIDDDIITFIGEDGCMGVYASMSVEIPLSYFKKK